MHIKVMTIFISLVIACFFIFFNQAVAENDVIVWGYVYDSETDEPLEGVRVEVEEAEDVSPALTNKKGKYSLVISDLTEARITFSKDQYKTLTTLVRLSQSKLKHDVRLEKALITLEMTAFKSGAYIRGKVEGLDSLRHKKNVILVYVLTDKWYIHPFAEKKPKRGFAPIDKNGNWEIETVWRGYQAYKVAFLLVPKDLYPPPKVELLKGKVPEIALLNTIASIAHKVIEAPEGI